MRTEPSSTRVGVFLAAFLFAGAALAQKESDLDRARRLDEAGQCAEAEAIYRALPAERAGAAVLNNLGNHYLACGQPAKAAETFERLLKDSPGHANANLQMARLAEARREPAEALRYLDRVANPDPEIRIAKAQALAETGRRDEARRILAGVQASAGDPRVLYAVAMACARAGFYAEAERAFERVLASDPGDIDVLFDLGSAAAHAGHFERARDAFTRVLEEKPNDAATLFELGRAEASLKNYKRAIFLLARAKQAEPRHPEIALALARATEAAGYFGDSVAAWDDYLAMRPEDETARRDRALALAYIHAKHDEAARELAEWVEKHPDDATGHYDLALVKGESDRPGAIAEVSRAVALDAHFEAALYYRAWLFEQTGRYEDSLRDAKAAVALDSRDARALDLAGLDELDLARPAAAEAPLRAALQLAPEDADILFHLARCLLETGRHAEAQPLMARFKELRAKAPETPREQAGIVEAATLPPDELARRVAAEYREGVAANPNDVSLRLRLGEALLGSGEVDEALNAFRRLLAMSADAKSLREAGNALLASGQYRAAIELLRPASEKMPAARLDLAVAEYYANGASAAAPDAAEGPDFHLLMALILDAGGKHEQAMSELSGIPGGRISHARLAADAAALLLRNGKAQDALALTGRALREWPDDQPLLLARVAATAACGRTDDALAEARNLERRRPEWDQPYLAEALLLERRSRPAEAAARVSIAVALGTRDPVAACLQSGSGRCGCAAGIWAAIAGCDAASR